MTPLTLPEGSIIEIRATPWTLPYSLSEVPAGTALTEHNRQPVQVTYERIEKRGRMINGTLRKVVIADKRTWSISWSDVPDNNLLTVDNKLGARSIEALYTANAGAIGLQINDGTVSERVNVVIKEFSKKINKRLPAINLWDITLDLEEI